MNSLTNLTRWVALACLGLATFWCLKDQTVTDPSDTTESVYSVSALEAASNSSPGRLIRIEEIESSPEAEAETTLASNEFPLEMPEDPPLEWVTDDSESVPNSMAKDEPTKSATNRPASASSESGTADSESELSSIIFPEDEAKESGSPTSKTASAAPTEPMAGAGGLGNTIRTNQISQSGMSKNPFFGKTKPRPAGAPSIQGDSDSEKSPPMSPSRSASESPAIGPSLPPHASPQASSSPVSEQDQGRGFAQIISSPIQFRESSDGAQANSNRQPRSTSLQLNESVAIRAVQHIEYGKTLARRGAKSSAKQEFLAALSIISQDLDTQSQSTRHSQALRRGMLALRESEEFAVSDSESQIGMDVSSLVESHQCGAMSLEEAQGVSPLQALQRYFGYAQVQIETGVGQNVISAEALYCLGRLYTLADGLAGVSEGKLDRARAMVYHRAALSCDANNYRSANELGVLLAEFGELQDSVELLKTSLRIRQTPNVWNNLAKVHERLNETQLAELANLEAQRVQSNATSSPIHWMESGQFNATAPREVQVAANPPAKTTPAQKPTSPDSEAKSSSQAQPRSLPDRLKAWF